MSLSNRHLINIIEGYAKRDQALPAHVWAAALEAGLDPQGIYDNCTLVQPEYQHDLYDGVSFKILEGEI